MRESKGEEGEIQIYESRPPEWLPKVSTAADLGYIGFQPPRPNQPEDLLSEANIKNGFSVEPAIEAESFTSVEKINQGLKSGSVISELEEFMTQIFARRADNIPPIPPSSFRIPTRVTLNEAKRLAWFADLANPEVPLHKLGKSVPHGAKGHDLLDLLQTNNVAIPRAVWFLRVFGANETAGLRNKPSYNPTQYSVEWANVVTNYLKKQLIDIALPTAPRPGLNIKQTFKGVLSDPETRERWVSRFSYCLSLLRTFYSEGLVDNRTFLSWLVQLMGSCTLAQAGFVARLADEYLDGMLVSRALMRPFIDACLNKLSEIRSTSMQEVLCNLEQSLKNLIQRACLGLSDAFVSPRMWTSHSSLIFEVLRERFPREPTTPEVSNVESIQRELLDNYIDIKARNDAMLFRDLPLREVASLGSAVSDVQLLNSSPTLTDLDAVTFFDVGTTDASAFARKLDILLSWCVTPLQDGDHRPYAAVTLLSRWRDQTQDRASRRSVDPPTQFLQDQLFDWLDTSDLAAEVDNLRAVAWLYGGLAKHELFSYTAYIQRLIARGEPGLSDSQSSSRHRRYLRWIPLQHSNSSLIIQRRVTLYGARSRGIPEDHNEREIRKEVRAALPELFEGGTLLDLKSPLSIASHCPLLVSACRFEQIRTIGQWFLPILRKHIVRCGADGFRPGEVLKTYCSVVALFELVKCYESILEISLLVLERVTTSEMLIAVIENLRRYSSVWICMHATGKISAALHAAHQYWRHQGIQTRPLLALLIEMDGGRYLDQTSREQVEADISALAHALCPESDHPDTVPVVLAEILLLAEDPNPEAPSILANSLWYKYRTASDWAWKVWDNTIASLRQIPMMRQDLSGRRACALRYGNFLFHVDQHLPHGFDHQVLQWCLGSGKNEVAALNADAWDVVTVVLLYLSVQGALTTTTILKGLVYAAWQMGASCNSIEQGQSLQVFLRAANNLLENLLLREESNSDDMPPSDLLELQRLFTRRQDVYREPHFSSLLGNIPLLVFIQQSQFVPEDIRSQCATIRHVLCKRTEFRQATYRDLDTVRVAFERSLDSETIAKSMPKPLVRALRLILNDSGSTDFGECEWQAMSSLFSLWKLSATAIELKFTLKQIAEGMSNESTRDDASASLDDFTAKFFHHAMTAEQADFVAEMTRGVGAAVARKFVNNGLKCVVELLNNVPDDLQSQALEEFQARTGELLRLVAHVLKSSCDEAPPGLESTIQDELFLGLCTKFEAAQIILEPDRENAELDSSQVTRFLILLARLLQFDLRCQVTWTSAAKELGQRMSGVLFRLALIQSAEERLDIVAHSLLLDTLCYLLDEMPMEIDPKTLIPDLFHGYPEIPLSELPPDMPTVLRARIRTLLPCTDLAAPVINLASTSYDASGNASNPVPVQNRPWEWVEHLGDQVNTDSKEDEKERQEKERLRSRYIVKNTASLPLELFGAQMTSDGVIRVENGNSRLESDLRSFEDGLWAESVFKRDWRETRVQLGSNPTSHIKSEEDEDGAVGGLSFLQVPGASDKHSASSRRASPASSVVSRSSAHALHASGSGSATGSNRQTPVPAMGRSRSRRSRTGSTMSEPIDVDGLNTDVPMSTGSKRSRAQDDGSEVEIINPPPGASGSSGLKAKKTKTKAAGKKGGKKKM